MQIKAVIDRFEGDKAVLLLGEAEIAVVWPRKLLPAGVKEGTIMQLRLTEDPAATRAARAAAAELLKEILESQDK